MQDKYRHIRSGFDGHIGDMKASLTQIVRRCALLTSAFVLHVAILPLLSFLLVQAAVTRLINLLILHVSSDMARSYSGHIDDGNLIALLHPHCFGMLHLFASAW